MYGNTGSGIFNDSTAAIWPVVFFSDIQGGYTGTGNINADPLFFNPTFGDYHLQLGSPCLGAGTSNNAPTTTLDGYTRPTPPSIGAFEAEPTTLSGQALLQMWTGAPQPLLFTLTPTGTTPGVGFSQTLTPAPDGSFQLSGIPAGTYTLGIKGSHWLKRDALVDTTGGDVSGLSLTLPAGDINGDGAINGLDLSAISAAFRTQPGDARWNASCDINGDGAVNGLDLSLASANFRKQDDR